VEIGSPATSWIADGGTRAAEQITVELGGFRLYTDGIHAGATGPAGERGEVGPQCPPGESIVGPQGREGPPGADSTILGPQGPPGESIVGPQGPQGPPGADSTVPGPQGTPGESIVGPQGPQGPQDPPGADSIVPGPQGPPGESIVSPQGPPGADGTGSPWVTLDRPHWTDLISFSNIGPYVLPPVETNFDIVVQNNVTPSANTTYNLGQKDLRFLNV
jgi:hypothetical protein